MARLSPVERDVLPEDQRRFWDAVRAIRRGPITGPFITFMNSNRDLAARVAHLGNYFHSRGQADVSPLPLRVRVLTALLMARTMDGVYEWNAWVPHALEAGVERELVDAIRERRPLDGLLRGDDPLVVDLCGQLLGGKHRLTEESYQAGIARFGVQGMVEFVVNLGYFTMLAFPLNAFEINLSAAQRAKRDPAEPDLPI